MFEAALPALGASRMPVERRHQLWPEPLPGAILVDRLRRLSIFDFTSVDELSRIVALGRQVRYEAGRLVYGRGVGVSDGTALQFRRDDLFDLLADDTSLFQTVFAGPLGIARPQG